jgi:hypothetical protein
MGVIICPAWQTIAEQTLPRSLPSVASLNLEYIRPLIDFVKEKKRYGLFF